MTRHDKKRPGDGSRPRASEHEAPPAEDSREAGPAQAETAPQPRSWSGPDGADSGRPAAAAMSPVKDRLRELGTDPAHGLTDEEAQSRLQQFGQNTIEEEKKSLFARIVSHFWGPIPWMLEAAVILSAAVGRWEELGVIGVMLLINGGVGFWHENEAQKAVEALKAALAPNADVIRDGKTQQIEARNLVPGDIVVLRLGELVPADVQLLPKQHLSVDESALTGKSLPVEKQEGDLCHSSTAIKRGEAKALVTATGEKTRFALTVQLVESAQEVSHFRRAVLRIGYFLIAVTAVLVAVIAAVEVWRGADWAAVITFALVVMIAGIPSALPAVLTVTMALGANTLASMKAIVTRLAAMEEMAGLQLLCADKTGTLTQNRLTLQDPVVLTARDERDLIIAAALTAEPAGQDAIDQAILARLENKGALDEYEIADFRPFDPNIKRAEVTVRHGGETFDVAKGAPQVILDLVKPDDETRQKVVDEVDRLGQDGLRALGVARRQGGSWVYLGLLPLLDPPREDTAEVIGKAKHHGIDIRMITGDHPAIARNVARQVGLGTDIHEARGYFAEETGEVLEERRQEVLDADGFAEVTPEHKFNIVKLFQQAGRIVGMTGDGVNDAPALKQADIGIAVEGATEAARAAADLVLTEPGLHVIIGAVEEARRIFMRMVSYATFRIAETMRVVLFVTIAILWFGDFPVTAIMVALLAILNDIPIMTIATDNAPTPDHPIRWNMPRVMAIASVLGFVGVLATLLLYWYMQTQMRIDQEQIRTAVFLKLLVAGHLTLFLTRNEGWFWDRPWPSLKLLLALEATQVIGTLICGFGFLVVPIPWWLVFAIWGYALAEMLLLNAVKIATYRWAIGRSEHGQMAAGQPQRSRMQRETGS